MGQFKTAKCQRCNQHDLVYPMLSIKRGTTVYICRDCKGYITKLRKFRKILQDFKFIGAYK